MSICKELQVDNLPPDILTGDYVWQWNNMDNKEAWSHCNWLAHEIISAIMRNKTQCKFRYRKPEQLTHEQPTHEEIMTKWWRYEDSNRWWKVTEYRNLKDYYTGFNKDDPLEIEDFQNLKSAIIPPEGE